MVISFEGGKPNLTDYFSPDFVTPTKDNCQDWTLLSYELVGNTTVVELRRDLETGDTQDRDIVEGVNRVLFAYGLSNQLALVNHEQRRGKATIVFWQDEDEDEDEGDIPVPTVAPGVLTAEFALTNFSIPSAQSSTICYAVPIPILPGSADQHIIQIDPILDPRTTQILYTFFVHICDNTSETYYANEYFGLLQFHNEQENHIFRGKKKTNKNNRRYLNNAGECQTAIGNPRAGCRSLLFTWGNKHFFFS